MLILARPPADGFQQTSPATFMFPNGYGGSRLGPRTPRGGSIAWGLLGRFLVVQVGLQAAKRFCAVAWGQQAERRGESARVAVRRWRRRLDGALAFSWPRWATKEFMPPITTPCRGSILSADARQMNASRRASVAGRSDGPRPKRGGAEADPQPRRAPPSDEGGEAVTGDDGAVGAEV